MRPRVVPALLVALALAACGGRAATPTAPSHVLNLVSGAYTLTVTMATVGDPVCNGVGCGSVGLCVGARGTLSATSVSAPVTVARSGDAVTIRPDGAAGTFRMDVQLSSTALAGTASGSFTDGRHMISVGSSGLLSGSTPPVVTGTLLSASASGKIDGIVGVDGYACSNNGHTWVLTPR